MRNKRSIPSLPVLVAALLSSSPCSAQATEPDGTVDLLVPRSMNIWSDETQRESAMADLKIILDIVEEERGSDIQSAASILDALTVATRMYADQAKAGAIADAFVDAETLALPDSVVEPNEGWFEIETALQLDPMRSAILRVQLSQAMGLRDSYSEGALQKLLLELPPDQRETIIRTICPGCYIIDGLSFFPVGMRPSGGDESSGYFLLDGASGREGVAGRTAYSKERRLSPRDRKNVEATVFLAGRSVAERIDPSHQGGIEFPDQPTFEELLYGENRFWRPMLYQLSYTPAAVVSLGSPARGVKRRSASYHSSYHSTRRSCSVLVLSNWSLKPSSSPPRARPREATQCGPRWQRYLRGGARTPSVTGIGGYNERPRPPGRSPVPNFRPPVRCRLS